MSERRVYLHPARGDERESSLRFRLVYEGELRPSGNDAGPQAGVRMAAHKHEIRQVFHKQLANLWNSNQVLIQKTVHPAAFGFPPEEYGDGKVPYRDMLAKLYPLFGYKFAPLVNPHMPLSCSLDVLFLRRDMPGGVFHSGDIDNRIKTLLDALRNPQNASEVAHNPTPEADETPFFTLLEDDKLIYAFSVETDHLFLPRMAEDREADQRWVNIVITVDIKPAIPSMSALDFI